MTATLKVFLVSGSLLILGIGGVLTSTLDAPARVSMSAPALSVG
ncbi:hypothetical protein [Azorhizobium sp. AG788]